MNKSEYRPARSRLRGVRGIAEDTLIALTLAAALAGPTHAQVVADPNGGAHKPSVIQTANGIQQVNITTPSQAGVSQNAYSQFDVLP
jgi:filamentous hemagglutinin